MNDGTVNPLLWPAVWLMNQLRYPRKFTLTTGLLRSAAHALIGLASNLGLTAFAELGGAIEAACDARQHDEAARLCERVEASWREKLCAAA